EQYVKLLPTTIILLTCASLDASSAAEASITLHKHSTVATRTVSLGQIAEIAPDKKLGAVLLGRAPAANRTRSLTLAYIKQRILQAGFDTDSIAFYGHTRPLILGAKTKANGAEDTGEFVKKPATNTETPAAKPEQETAESSEASEAKTDDASNVDGIVKAALVDIRNLYDARLELDLEISEYGRSRSLSTLKSSELSLLKVVMRGRSLTLGKVDFALSVQSGSRQINGLTLTIFAEAIVQRVALTRPLARGKMLSASDVELRDVRTTKLSESGFTKVDDVLELQLIRAMPAGDVLTQKHVQSARLIKRGQTVLVTQHVGRVKLTVEAKALEDGTKGEVIRLKRGKGKEAVELSARVTGAGKATTSKEQK
ncbi:MAG: flagellar basal body P-ring formation chaperone FlgA, partial [Planctomycetes bacterium]|nr:flagellar basal body P-ring formation chaperone FlgA [Planctomycetota bacterium]